MQSCYQCNELPLNAKLLSLHTNFYLIDAGYNQVGSFFFCADFVAQKCRKSEIYSIYDNYSVILDICKFKNYKAFNILCFIKKIILLSLALFFLINILNFFQAKRLSGLSLAMHLIKKSS